MIKFHRNRQQLLKNKKEISIIGARKLTKNWDSQFENKKNWIVWKISNVNDIRLYQINYAPYYFFLTFESKEKKEISKKFSMISLVWYWYYTKSYQNDLIWKFRFTRPKIFENEFSLLNTIDLLAMSWCFCQFIVFKRKKKKKIEYLLAIRNWDSKMASIIKKKHK